MKKAILAVAVLIISLVGCTPSVPESSEGGITISGSEDVVPQDVQDILEVLDESEVLDADLDDSDIESIEEDLALIDQI